MERVEGNGPEQYLKLFLKAFYYKDILNVGGKSYPIDEFGIPHDPDNGRKADVTILLSGKYWYINRYTD